MEKEKVKDIILGFIFVYGTIIILLWGIINFMTLTNNTNESIFKSETKNHVDFIILLASYLYSIINFTINCIYKNIEKIIGSTCFIISLLFLSYITRNGININGFVFIRSTPIIFISGIIGSIIKDIFKNIKNKNSYKKGNDFYIFKKDKEFYCKTNNGEFGPYTEFYNKTKILTNYKSNINFPYPSSYNNNTGIFLTDSNIGIGTGERVNLAGINQKFIDIIDLGQKEKLRIYIDEISLIYNNNNNLFINYKNQGIWKTIYINYKNLKITGENQEQLSSHLYVIYNNSLNLLQKLTLKNNGYELNNICENLGDYKIINYGKNGILLESINESDVFDIDIINVKEKGIIEKNNINEFLYLLGIYTKLNQKNKYKIYVFEDIDFSNMFFLQNARNFLNNTNKIFLQKERQQKEKEKLIHQEEMRKDAE